MNEIYSEYLNSEAWAAKRNKRLNMSNRSCAVCGRRKKVHIHHLTYERIFNEDMADLLPLCFLHHKAAEDLIASGLIARVGDVVFLAKETIRMLTPQKIPKAKIIRSRNSVQSELMSQQWFIDALSLDKKAFRSLINEKFGCVPSTAQIMSNAIGLYQRHRA